MALSGKTVATVTVAFLLVVGGIGGGAYSYFNRVPTPAPTAAAGSTAKEPDSAATTIQLIGMQTDSTKVPLYGGDTALVRAESLPVGPKEIKLAPAAPSPDAARIALEVHLRDSIAAAMRKEAARSQVSAEPTPAPRPRRPKASTATPTAQPSTAMTTAAAGQNARAGAGNGTGAGNGGEGSKGEAVAPAPVRRAPFIEAGTSLSFVAETKVCVATARAGDAIQASTSSTVTGPDGAVIPAGSLGELRVMSVGENGQPFVLRLRSITVDGRTVPASGDVTAMALGGTKGDPNAGKKMVAGAAIGALAGKLLGKSTAATAVGAVVGTAGGAAIAHSGDSRCLPAGGRLSVTLGDPITLR